MIKGYDPNMVDVVHFVDVTLMQWDYKATIRVKIAGNCRGFDILETAASMIEDSRDGVYLVNEKGNTLKVEEPEAIAEAIIGLQIVEVKPG